MTIPARRLTARDAYRQAVEVTAFGATHELPVDSRVYASTTSGGGTVTHVAAEAAYKVQATTASGDRAVLRSHTKPRAAAGRARTCVVVGHASAAVTSQVLRWGLFDDNNGYYFERDGETLYAVRRSNVSGTVVETRVANAQWNEEHTSVETTYTHVWEIREAWPNGDVSYFVDGVLVHVTSTDGSIMGPGTRFGRLPVSVEARNPSAVSASGSFSCIAAAIYVEEEPPPSRSFGAHISDASVDATGQALLSIRPKSTFSSIANYGELLPDELTIAASGDCRVQLVAGATVSDGSWASHDAASLAESNTTTTALPSGVVVAEYVCSGTLAVYLGELLQRVRLLSDGSSTQDTLTVVAKSLTGSAISVRASLTWREVR